MGDFFYRFRFFFLISLHELWAVFHLSNSDAVKEKKKEILAKKSYLLEFKIEYLKIFLSPNFS